MKNTLIVTAGARTLDLEVKSLTLYQLSYSNIPTVGGRCVYTSIFGKQYGIPTIVNSNTARIFHRIVEYNYCTKQSEELQDRVCGGKYPVPLHCAQGFGTIC